jgi:hypothetical protein
MPRRNHNAGRPPVRTDDLAVQLAELAACLGCIQPSRIPATAKAVTP